MGCATCSTGGCGSKSSSGVAGCGSKGNCSCNRLNTFDWLSDIDLPTLDEFNIVEVSFKNGSRKSFYLNPGYFKVYRGDDVVVESGTGFDVGRVSLTGELVKLQMKKKRFKDPSLVPSIIRRANDRDLERLADARQNEPQAMVRARVIARDLKLDMKIGDVEYQGDRRKATFYYTADGRVDFRELIKLFAKEFRVKIEMRQIGARQESARIGGIGSCGRELCCSTWLSDFKSVSTAAARYQNLAINQAKLSGQCGRLKCCLNFELDSYMDALEAFPERADKLETEAGLAVLMKTDIFKKTMYYTYKKEGFSKIYPLHVSRVKEILALNKTGKKPVELVGSSMLEMIEEEPDFGDVTGSIELADLDKHKKPRKRRNRNRKKDSSSGKGQGNSSKSETPNNKSNQKSSNQRGSGQKQKSNQRSNQTKNRGNHPRKQQGEHTKEQPKSKNTNQPSKSSQDKPNQQKTENNQNRNRSRGKSKPNDKKGGSRNPRFKKEKSGEKPQNQTQKTKNQSQNKSQPQNKPKNKTNNPEAKKTDTNNNKQGNNKPNNKSKRNRSNNKNRNNKRRFNNRNNNSNNNNK